MLLATLAILVATLYPFGKSLPLDIWSYDKLGHFIMFGAWTFFYGLYRAAKKKGRPNLFIVFSLGSFYGLLIEFLQFVVPTNRSPETLDFIADMIGSLAAVLLLKFIFKFSSEDEKDSTA